MSRDIRDITVEEYHEHPAISSGAVRCLITKGPLDLWWEYIARKSSKREETVAKRLGGIFHLAQERPDTWDNEILRVPDVFQDDPIFESIVLELESSKSTAAVPSIGEPLNMQRKASQLYVSGWQSLAEEESKTCVYGAEWDTIQGQINAVHDNPEFRDFLGAEREKAAFLECPETGLELKGLFDLLRRGEWFLDWKTTKKRNLRAFWRDFEHYGYGYQIAHYRHVIGIENHFVGTVTNDAPFEAQLIEIEWPDIADCYDKAMLHLKAFAGLMRQHQPDDDTDSQDVPLVFHNEFWGTCVPSSALSTDSSPVWADAEVVEVPDGED